MTVLLRERKPNRLRQYDYSNGGYYFITICTRERGEWFGKIENGKMVLNDAGKMIDKWWHELFKKYNEIEMDEYCIMPNHVHGIIEIVGADLRVRPNIDNVLNGQTHRSVPTLGNVVRWFKTMSTNEYMDDVRLNNWFAFEKCLWQRSFYDHIIRNDASLNRIREYINNNPAQWDIDVENSENKNNSAEYYKNIIGE